MKVNFYFMLLALFICCGFTLTEKLACPGGTSNPAMQMVAGEPKDTSECLRVKCNTVYKGKKIGDFKITLYENDSLFMQTYQVKKPKKLTFNFARDKHFLLLYYKEGFYPRKLRIDTSLPGELSLKEIFSFRVDMELLLVENKISNKYNPEKTDAVIRYHPATKKFKLFREK